MFNSTSPTSPRAHNTQINVKAWQVMFSLLLAGRVVKAYYDRFDSELTSFADRAIGIAVLTGVDASARTLAYFGMIATFLLVTILGIVLLTRAQNELEKSFRWVWIEIDQKILFTLSTIAFVVLLLAVLSRKPIYEHVVSTLLFLICLELFLVIANFLFFRMSRQRLRWFENHNIRFLALCFPIVIFFIDWVYLKRPFTLIAAHYAWFVVLWLLFYIAYAVLVRVSSNKNIEKARLDRALIASGTPFILIPVSIPLSNELQFTISHITDISSRQLSGGIIAALILISIGTFAFIVRKPAVKIRASKIIQNLYFPVCIATSVIFFFYQPSLDVAGFDMFHDGESLIVAQQAFEFGQMPYIDQLPTHGLSEVHFQFLYSWINGYRAIEPWLWAWINDLLAFVLIYYLMKIIIDPLSALLITLLLPITAVLLLDNYYAMLIFPALGLLLLRKKGPVLRKYALLWLICIAALLWRLDFGIAVTLAYIFVVALNLAQNAVVLRSSIRSDIRKVITSFALVFGSGILLYVLAVLINQQSIQESLIQNFQFIKIMAPAMSFPGLSRSYSPLVVLQYGLLPGIAVFYLAYAVYQVFFRKEAVSSSQMTLVFLGVVSLLMSFRSVQRHTLLEGYDPYLFVFLLVVLPFYVNKTQRKVSLVIFSALLLSYIMIFPKYSMLVKGGEIFKFRTWRDKESRVQVSPGQYDDLVSFLNHELQEGQTFYDFSNSPMLYVLTGKRLVTATVPNLLMTSEAIQLAELKRLGDAYHQNAIPFVVFRQGNWWDYVDNVPNEVRSYRIAEFIYAHYKPFADINNYMVWAKSDLDLNSLLAEETGGMQSSLVPIESFSQEFILMKLPYIWGNYDEGGAAVLTDDLAVLIDQPMPVDSDQPLLLHFDPKIDKTSGNYIHLRIQADASATLTLTYGENGRSRIIFDVIPSEVYKDYLVRISTQWEWMSQPIDTLRVAVSAPVQIERIQIKKGD